MLHQLGLGTPGLIILDAMVATQRGWEAIVEEALCGAHEELARPCLHVVFLEVLGEWEVGVHFRAARKQGAIRRALGKPLLLLPSSWQPGAAPCL